MVTTTVRESVTIDLEASFMGLYEREAPTVLRYMRMAVGGLDAEDATADTFLSAWPAWARFNGDAGAARGWIMRIARNKAIDRARAGRRAVMVPLDDATASAGPDHDAADAIQLRAALARLSTTDRELLALRAAGLSHAEIGVVQKRKEDAVKMAAHRALARLRQQLGDDR